jgi:cytochrome c oxidase cbb3-type subunit 3
VLDHEYDGIREYDNKLPNWWLYTLYGAIVFSVGYWLVFHPFGVGKLPRERYVVEMTTAAEAQLARMEGQEIDDEALTLMASIPERVEAGRQVFGTFCVVCHTESGGGSVGPNLTDAYWIHGGAPTDILLTVTQGVPDKGMAAWGGQLGPRRVQAVVSYVLTLKNTNAPGGKAPEGNREGEAPADPDDPMATGNDANARAVSEPEPSEG